MSDLRSQLDSVRCSKNLINNYVASQTIVFDKMATDADFELRKLDIQEERLKKKIREENNSE